MGILAFLGLRRSSMWERPTALDVFLTSPLQWFVFRVFQLFLVLRGRPFQPPRDKPLIRVVCLSDTHERQLGPVPDGDLLIHAGDLTDDGRVDSIQKQLDWLAALPHTHKVFIAGNHDSWFDPASRAKEDKESGATLDFKGMHYLENSAVALEFKEGRRLNVYGSPAVPQCGGSSFSYVSSFLFVQGRFSPF
jgi:predicted MPP superfamily phosphohydrolase